MISSSAPPKPAAAPAKPTSKFPPPAFKITIGTEGAFPPFNYLDRKGLPAGFEMELAQEACQRIKAECEFAAFKWNDLIPGLIDKKFDVLMSSMEVTAERRKRLGLTRRYYISPGAFAAAKGALDQETVMKLAKEAGLDMAQLKRDLNSAAIDEALKKNRDLAGQLEITGTPAFIIGKEFVPGAAELDTFKTIVARARKG